MHTPASDLERLRAIAEDMERDRETFDFKIAIDARAHEIKLRAVCDHVPIYLISCLRGRLWCQKRAGTGDCGHSPEKYRP